MKKYAERESLFTKKVPLDTSLQSDFSQHQQDYTANFILDNYHCTPGDEIQLSKCN
ncbi:MAG: hypothetical protein KZQ70_14085 [gamma proteobacterium symbiont of Lucinoma myriamae]|nr:hypothetical protein [gamma proteobacterium symbiont of Lucinoma myriamae]